MNNQEEVWKDVVGYEGSYQVSNKGDIRSCDRFIDYMNGPLAMRKIQKGRPLKFMESHVGHYRVELSDGIIPKKYFVHRLVAIAFIPNPNNYPIINHLDCDPKNNNVENLEWTTISGNVIHAYANGLMPKERKKGSISHNSQLVIDLSTGIFYDSTEKAAIAKGLKAATLRSWFRKGQIDRTSLRYA
jgi:hypothetical protein